MAKSKYKHVRRNGRSVFIDTTTGKEVTFGSRPYKSLLARLKALPQHVVDQTKRAAQDIGDNIVYSDRLDNKGRLQTRAQARVNTPPKGPGGDPSGSGRGQAQQRTKPPKPAGRKPNKANDKLKPGMNPRTNKPYSESPGKPSSPPASPPTRSSSPSKPSKPSKPARKPQSKDMDENYRAWAKANPKLALKVKKGQAGYKAINNKPKPSSSNSTAKKVSRLAQVLAGKKGLASKKKDRRMSGRTLSNRNTA